MGIAMIGLKCLLVASLLIGHAQSTVFFDDFQTQWWITSQIFYLEKIPSINIFNLRRRRRGVHGNVTSRSFFGSKAKLVYDSCIVDIYMSLSVPFVVPFFTKTKHDDEEQKIYEKNHQRRRRSLEASNRTESRHLLPLDVSTTAISGSKDLIMENASLPETSGPFKLKSNLYSTLTDGVVVESKGEIQNMSKLTTDNQCPKPENVTLRSKRVKRTIFYDDHVVSYYLTMHFYINDVFYEVFASYLDIFFPLGLNRPRDSSAGRALHLVTDSFLMDFYITVDCPFVVPILRRTKEEEYFENQLYQNLFSH